MSVYPKVFIPALFFVGLVIIGVGLYGSITNYNLNYNLSKVWQDATCSISMPYPIRQEIFNCTCKCKCVQTLPHSVDCVDHSLNNGVVLREQCSVEEYGCKYACDLESFRFCEVCQYKIFSTSFQLAMSNGDQDPFDTPNRWLFDYPFSANDSKKAITDWVNRHVDCYSGGCDYTLWDCSYQPPYSGKGVPKAFREGRVISGFMFKYYMFSWTCFGVGGLALVIASVWLMKKCCATYICIKRSQYRQIKGTDLENTGVQHKDVKQASAPPLYNAVAA